MSRRAICSASAARAAIASSRRSIPDSASRRERQHPSCRLCQHNGNRERAMKRIVPAMVGVLVLASACGGDDDDDGGDDTAALVAQGKKIFRFETFGDEAKWTDTLRMHEVIAAAVDPTTALLVGLKVDAEALPQALKDAIANGTVDLASPATTITLLKLDAVVGLKGTVETVGGVDQLKRVGTTCALCHSTVDDSFSPGIGKRLDGWPNRDLDVGRIIALSPAVDGAE